MHNTNSAYLAVEMLNPKDQYETPAQLWRWAVSTFGLDCDAHASSLNAVLPAYSTRHGACLRAGARFLLNPAYGGRCVSIGDALAAHVWQRDCAVVVLLPALMHTDWCPPRRMHTRPSPNTNTRTRAHTAPTRAAAPAPRPHPRPHPRPRPRPRPRPHPHAHARARARTPAPTPAPTPVPVPTPTHTHTHPHTRTHAPTPTPTPVPVPTHTQRRAASPAHP